MNSRSRRSRSLGGVDTPAALDSLRRALSAALAARRAAAAEALARRGSADAIELLQWTAAVDLESTVIRAAIDGLGRIGAGTTPHARAAMAAIAALAADPLRRAEVIGALARVPDAAIPRVGDALSSTEPAVRRAVIEALGRRTHPAASAYVLTALEDADPSVRQLAVIDPVAARHARRGAHFRRACRLGSVGDRPAGRRSRAAAAAEGTGCGCAPAGCAMKVPSVDALGIPLTGLPVLRDLLHERTGLFFDEDRTDLLADRMAPLVRRARLSIVPRSLLPAQVRRGSGARGVAPR